MFTSKPAGFAFTDPNVCKEDDMFGSVGNLVTEEEIKAVLKVFAEKKYKKHWDCLNKSREVAKMLKNKERGVLTIHIGSLFVLSPRTNSSYGYAFNPPLEIHSWAFSTKQRAIYDFALPGVILSGLSLSDHIGPYLEAITPVIMAEKVFDIPEIYRYKCMEIHEA